MSSIQGHDRGFGRFLVRKELAQTLQGRLYSGYDRQLNRKCAIKEGWKTLIQRNVSRHNNKHQQCIIIDEDFEKEVSTMLEFAHDKDPHPNIIHGFHVWHTHDCSFVAMEFCEQGLFTLIQNSASSSFKKPYSQTYNNQIGEQDSEWIKYFVKPMFRQMVDAVKWMLDRNYSHSDLSLENTMLLKDLTPYFNGTTQKPFSEISNDIHVKIIDLGLIQKFENNQWSTNRRVGKTQYMSPENHASEWYDARANDIYCLGMMLFIMLFHCAPYQKPSRQSSVFRHLMNGGIGGILADWKLLHYATPDAIDLLTKMLCYEPKRITIADLLKQPFVVSTLTRAVDASGNDSRNNDINVDVDSPIRIRSQMAKPKLINEVKAAPRKKLLWWMVQNDN